ncbi:hypothetical protein HW532_12715 [Kaustia mangrovi]|uniref:Uncharacterized protein n=1 Tax=Kaustia mangrovi TaxID=2593653 RepID=A0A7S8C4X6_9HYPH|nr:hypothetical protein [Kaustia mangrovi]QPC43480.1 hypothetical protein HW532_12715 [Kaustia mangrovi]
MTGAVEWQVLVFMAGGAVALGGLLWRLYNAIAKSDRDLAAYKLHVSETYVTKAGLSEQTRQIMDAIGGVNGSIERLNERIDRVFEAPKPARRRRSTPEP